MEGDNPPSFDNLLALDPIGIWHGASVYVDAIVPERPESGRFVYGGAVGPYGP